MKVSELIEKLCQYDKDLPVMIEVDYYGGEYGEHNCSKSADITYIYIDKDHLVLNGNG